MSCKPHGLYCQIPLSKEGGDSKSNLSTDRRRFRMMLRRESPVSIEHPLADVLYWQLPDIEYRIRDGDPIDRREVSVVRSCVGKFRIRVHIDPGVHHVVEGDRDRI